MNFKESNKHENKEGNDKKHVKENNKAEENKEDSEENLGKNWNDLPATEKESYLGFHKSAFEEDLKHADKNVLEFPRWSVISGYYCMHDATKFFLAKKFNVKITSPEIHSKTIRALEHFVKDVKLKNKLIEMLREAKDAYYNAERLKERILPLLLKRGRQERGKAQYYSEDYSKEKKVDARKAGYFLETIVKPYVKIIEKLLKED